MNKLLKSFLHVAENPKNISSFVWLYLLIGVIWHNQFLLTFASTQGEFSVKLNAALNAMGHFEYMWVFSITLLLFISKLTFDYIIKASRERVILEEQNKKTTLVDVDTSNDMQQLISVLEDLKEQLKRAEENEKNAKQKTKQAIAQYNAVQQQLEELTADFDIVRRENHELKEQAKSISAAVNT